MSPCLPIDQLPTNYDNIASSSSGQSNFTAIDHVFCACVQQEKVTLSLERIMDALSRLTSPSIKSDGATNGAASGPINYHIDDRDWQA